MKRAPQPGDEGFAVHRVARGGRAIRFRARVLNVVTGRTGPALVVTAIDQADWHRLPASSVVVPLCDFAPRDICVPCGGSGAVEVDGVDRTCTDCLGAGRREGGG